MNEKAQRVIWLALQNEIESENLTESISKPVYILRMREHKVKESHRSERSLLLEQGEQGQEQMVEILL